MSQLGDAFIAEVEQEAEATRRTLERVPGDKLDWRPHEKSRTLGELARHVATIPGDMAQMFASDSMDVSEIEPSSPTLESTDELLPLLQEAIATWKETLGGMDDDQFMAHWKMVAGDQTVMDVPRVGCYRMYGLNHWYHHRAQLGVYLRLLDVPHPAIYGPSADENPMAEAMAAARSGAANS